MINIQDLNTNTPHLIWSNIFFFLDRKDLPTIERVCKLWHKISKEDNVLWTPESDRIAIGSKIAIYPKKRRCIEQLQAVDRLKRRKFESKTISSVMGTWRIQPHFIDEYRIVYSTPNRGKKSSEIWIHNLQDDSKQSLGTLPGKIDTFHSKNEILYTYVDLGGIGQVKTHYFIKDLKKDTPFSELVCLGESEEWFENTAWDATNLRFASTSSKEGQLFTYDFTTQKKSNHEIGAIIHQICFINDTLLFLQVVRNLEEGCQNIIYDIDSRKIIRSTIGEKRIERCFMYDHNTILAFIAFGNGNIMKISTDTLDKTFVMKHLEDELNHVERINHDHFLLTCTSYGPDSLDQKMILIDLAKRNRTVIKKHEDSDFDTRISHGLYATLERGRMIIRELRSRIIAKNTHDIVLQKYI